MKKMLILAVLVVALVALSANVALAGSWWQVSPTGISAPSGTLTDALDLTGDGDIGLEAESAFRGTRGANTSKTDDWGTRADYYSDNQNPHGGFATTSNYCKTCHAVHDAGAGSYRLLKSGNTTQAYTPGESIVNGLGSARANECMYCHNAESGATKLRPYALGVVATVRGEHTIGATAIPDIAAGAKVIPNRDPVNQPNTFGCYDCHSVHGANVLAFWDAGLILRDDPNNDGAKVTDVRVGFAPDSGDADRANYQRNNFCADCHNGNASWDTDTSDTNRTSKTSHVTGPAADGQLEVYGSTKTVAWTRDNLSSPAGTGNAGVRNRGCRGCHNSADGGTNIVTNYDGNISAWPHQTLESKMLLSNGYNGEDPNNDINRAGILTGAADTNRGLYKMDAVCLRCHSGDGAGAAGAGAANFAVGETF